MTPAFTLAICTYNRAALLREALLSLRACQDPGCRWELLLIDNHSRDQTAAVARESADVLPLRYLFEAEQGLSAARNRALREARGDVLLFTDDDLRFEPDWLARYAAAFAAHPEAGWFGGRVRPLWPKGRPRWLKDESMALISGLLVRYDLGDTDRPYRPGEPTPFGASFALRRAVFERVGGFRTDLGVKGDVPGRGEEAEYFDRLLAAAIPGHYVGSAVAWHWQDPRRFRPGYLIRYGVQKGIAAARTGHGRRGSAGRALWFLVQALAQWLRGRGDRARQCLINVGIQQGLRASTNASRALRG